MSKIFLSPSTQEKNEYAGGSTEEAEMRKVAAFCQSYLVDAGHTVKMGGTASATDSKNASNNWGADWHVAIHSNAGGGQGTEVFYYPGSTASKNLAQAIYDRVAVISPGKDRGLKDGSGLVEVNATKAPACLVEVEFHDNATLAGWIRANAQPLGKAIADGIIAVAGGKAGSGGGSSSSTGSTGGTTSGTYTGGSIVDYLKSIGVDSSLSNRQQLAVKYGIVGTASAFQGSAIQNTLLLNKMRSGAAPSAPTTSAKATLTDVANAVIAGEYGNNPQRAQKLRAEGYDPAVVQSLVNQLLGHTPSTSSPGKSIDTLAYEVIAGNWGNNPSRKEKLTAAYGASVATQVQNRVNQLLK